jgi:universal stress protein E
MNQSDLPETFIDHVLVVVDPNQFMPGQPEQRDLLKRALDLAHATGCKLELFTAYHEPTLELSLFADREEVRAEKVRLTNSVATRLGEIAMELENRGARVTHEARWDHPYADALLRKISETEPDIVLKQTQGPNYVLGLTDNPDWELIRNSPSNVWFVKPGAPDINTVLTAIGGTTADVEIISQDDYQVFEVGNMLAGMMGARNVPAHSFEAPKLHAYAAYAPVVIASTQIAGEADTWQQVARLHGRAIREFAEHFDLDVSQIEIAKGQPADVIPSLAKSLDAGLVVMGARNLGRWARAFQSVSAEPVLSSVSCDIFFVKEARDATIPEADEQPKKGVPSVDIEMAITHPDQAFESPEEVAETDDLTVGLRRRILDAWELDINAQLKAVDEGGPVQETPASLLVEINRARESLAGTHH